MVMLQGTSTNYSTGFILDKLGGLQPQAVAVTPGLRAAVGIPRLHEGRASTRLLELDLETARDSVEAGIRHVITFHLEA